MPLKFNCTIGYIEYLQDQLQGRQQPIHPCLVFKIQSFSTLGPRLGVYLDGTPYSGISIGDFGGHPEKSPHESTGTGVENTKVGLTIEVDDKQIIELQSTFQSISTNDDPPYTWATIIPKGAVRRFERQTSLLNNRLKEALSKNVPARVECPHCGQRHSRKEVNKSIKTRPDLSILQSEDKLDPGRILIEVRCPTEPGEIESYQA